MGFLEDVEKGLSAGQKFLYSRYFYDAEGDRIFQSIMKMPEYYLTDSEFEIFSTKSAEILSSMDLGRKSFELVEFGAGDGMKTKVLIQKLLEEGASFRYMPIDISGDVLEQLRSDFLESIPNLEIMPVNKEYFAALEHINEISEKPKLLLFIGSSIGNFDPERIRTFMDALRDILRAGDKVMIGFDLKKDPNIILRAYNDPRGITKAFNLNILRRINRELGGDFELEAFDHYPMYDPESGLAKSYLVSLKKQEVWIKALNASYSFERGECIHTEISRKFSIEEIEAIAENSNMRTIDHFFDCKHYFVDTLFEIKA